jgi:hypothetical protein
MFLSARSRLAQRDTAGIVWAGSHIVHSMRDGAAKCGEARRKNWPTNGKRGVGFSRRQERESAVCRFVGAGVFRSKQWSRARRGALVPGVGQGPGAPKRCRRLGIYSFSLSILKSIDAGPASTSPPNNFRLNPEAPAPTSASTPNHLHAGPGKRANFHVAPERCSSNFRVTPEPRMATFRLDPERRQFARSGLRARPFAGPFIERTSASPPNS